MIYGAAARGFIMPGDFFNLGISILMALLCTFLPNLMARSQMKKCKKRGLLGERTLRFTEQVLTMTYEKEGRSTDIPLEELTKVTEFDNLSASPSEAEAPFSIRNALKSETRQRL